MASHQQTKGQLGDVDLASLTQGGTGPEYEYPTTGKDEPIAVVEPSEEDAKLKTAGDPAHAAGENAPPIGDDEVAREEELEAREAGEWSEDMAQNEPLPGEVEDDPDLLPLASDRG